MGRIFREYLNGNGDRAIANLLNVEGVPSMRRPDQNRHRLPDGWQGSGDHPPDLADEEGGLGSLTSGDRHWA